MTNPVSAGLTALLLGLVTLFRHNSAAKHAASHLAMIDVEGGGRKTSSESVGMTGRGCLSNRSLTLKERTYKKRKTNAAQTVSSPRQGSQMTLIPALARGHRRWSVSIVLQHFDADEGPCHFV